MRAMQFSRALRALPVVFCLGPSAPDASLAAQARYRITTDGAWFFQEAGGKRLARLARGAQVAGGDARGDWLAVTLEGWIFATSVGPTPRAGFDLAVTRTPEENLRSAPAGALVGKLPQGFLLTRVADGATDRWVHVTRTGWVQKGDVEPIAAVVSSRTAADSDTVVAAPPPGRSPGVAATPEPPGRAGDEGTPGHRARPTPPASSPPGAPCCIARPKGRRRERSRRPRRCAC
ncbi:MAG: hypothetical protein AUI88_02355 [Gemmatimonadetes bacterium 13_1_40CM_3_70_8]|nr:MAG: hypothetical protein AUI88_02355 [Gemmatimonadetes bacterium 13_1_40CM_3_70_8]